MRRAVTYSGLVSIVLIGATCAGALADDPSAMTRDEWIRLIDQRISESALASPLVQDPPMVDMEQIGRGEAAFRASCTTCHDAQRSLERRKSQAGWVATVRRMATKEGADIAGRDIEPIAVYLASLGPPVTMDGDETLLGSQTTLFATISPLWRGANNEREMENPDFFVDAWVGADWQPTGPISGRAVACTSCHSDRNSSSGFTLELVEAAFTLDLTQLWHGHHRAQAPDPAVKSSVKAGRFIVPFGAFSSMSYPGVYRTVTNPLMFNMGRRVGPIGPLQPVLPAPFSDEGVNLHVDAALWNCWTMTVDLYAVNGLRGNGPSLFNFSRSYTDNNREPTFGGRATVGNQFVRFGGSMLAGNLADNGQPPISYKLGGVDATARWDDRWRFYFEYAIREDDSTSMPNRKNYVYGMVAELEAYVLPRVSLLARYDTLEHRDTIFGNASQERFTSGVNLQLPGGSWAAINHEHWIFGDGGDVDVLGVRWTATF